MNGALSEVPDGLEFQVPPFGVADAYIVTGRKTGGQEPGG
jgi:hypothetical protein